MTTPIAAPCVVCGSAGFPIGQAEDAGHDTDICKCRQCRLEYAAPMPSHAQLEQLYSDYVYYSEYDRAMIRATVVNNSRKNIDYLARFGLHRDKSLLDFGCGENIFVETGNSPHWIGYDYPHDDPAIIHRQPYDFITLWGVLEHLPDPMAIIRELAGALVSGGKLVMTTVGTETGIPYRYRFPVHLTWWSRDAIGALLAQNGFQLLELSNYQMLQNPRFYLDRVLDRGRVPDAIKAKISIAIDEDILVPTNEILVVAEKR